MDEKFYTPKEVAEILKVTYMTVYRWIRSGKLKGYQVQKQYRVTQEDLNLFIKKQ